LVAWQMVTLWSLPLPLADAESVPRESDPSTSAAPAPAVMKPIRRLLFIILRLDSRHSGGHSSYCSVMLREKALQVT
jgi:hypothetical protein